MSVSQSTRSHKTRGVQDPPVTHDKVCEHDGNTQAELEVENSNPLSTESGDQTERVAKVIKRCRFKRRALGGMIARYTDATKQLMEQGGSRAAIKQNMSDILDKFKEIESLNTQLEEHLQEDEQLMDDMMALTDIRLKVNNFTGMIQEHLDERTTGSRNCSKSQSGSQDSSSSPAIQEEDVDPHDECNEQDEKEREVDRQQVRQAAKLSELARQKRAEAAQLQKQADEAERQSVVISKEGDFPKATSPVLPKERELHGSGKAALYVKHLEEVKELKPEIGHEDEDWIAQFQKGYNVEPRAVDPGKIPVRAEVPVYHGDPLQWLSWSGLFKALVHDTRMTSEAKMGFLHTKLSKDCDRVIAGLFPDDEGYAEALMLLRDRYGHPTMLQAAHLQALKSLAPIDSVSQENLSVKFQSFVDQARSHLAVLRRYSSGESPFVSSFIYELTDKLPQEDAKAWRTKVGEGQVAMTLGELSTWLGARGRSYWSALPPRNTYRDNRRRDRRSLHNQGKTSKCSQCSADHKTKNCAHFKELSAEDWLNLVKEKRLCFGCLEESHISRNCKSKRECGISGCKAKHHPLLHLEQNASTTTTKAPHSGIAFGIIEVSVVGASGNEVKGNLLFDDGSDTTLVSELFVKKLGLRGKKTTLRISGVGGKASRKASTEVILRIKTPEGSNEHVNLKAWSLASICQPVETVPWPEIKSKWKHLEKLDLKSVGGEIDILLGLDHADLLVPQEVKTGRPQEPVARKTSFGWTAVDPIGTPASRHRVHHVFRADAEPLDVAFKQFWESETFGTNSTDEPIYSKDENRAMDLLEHGTVKLKTGYQVPLLWNEDEPRLQNNRQVALKRFEGLERRFGRDPEYEEDYRKAIGKYVENGYAVKVNEDDDVNGPKQWYLPHHGVYKKSATERKQRVVFDAAAKYNGKSLNDALLPGPTLQNELPHVLTKFREGDIGFGADIEAMFSRVRLREEDARYHRFLWKEKGSDKIDTYQMNRLAFGDTSSPCEAIYTTRRTAADFGMGKEEAVKAIKENLYVDDYLDSAESTQEAIHRGKQVKDILAEGDFHLRKWVSNSPEVTAALGNDQTIHDTETDPNCKNGKDVTNLADHEPVPKILRVKWNTVSDELTFGVTPIEDVTYTRRGLLSKLAGIFDPLGFCSPFTIKAKILTQQLCLLGLDWDDPIPPSHVRQWKDWLSKLPELEEIQLPRCIQPRKAEVESSELHTFCDASEEAFSAVVYLRSLYADGNVVCSMVMAKTKVAPKKALSVARLELQAALLGARLATYVRKALTRPINRLVFWTDRKCVIGWVRSTTVWYKPFVAHRIGEIQTLTDSKSWRHLPGRLNVSDCATRSRFDDKTELIPGRWFSGPDFLYQSEDHWRREIPIEETREATKIMPSKVFIASSKKDSTLFPADVDLTQFLPREKSNE